MFRVGVASLAVACATAFAAPPARGAEVDLVPGPKYKAFTFTAKVGEKNNVNIQSGGDMTFVWAHAALFVDLGSPILNSRDLACVNSVFSAVCAADFTEKIIVDLGDLDDRVDVTGNSALGTEIKCGMGWDKVVVTAAQSISVPIDPDCEELIVV